MEQAQQKLTQLLLNAIKQAFPESNLNPALLSKCVEVPKPEFGNLTVGCGILTKPLRMEADAIASKILDGVKTSLSGQPSVQKIELSGGKINITYPTSFLAQAVLPGILDGTSLAKKPFNGQKVMVEYSQPNTHKAFHVGHMRNVALGDSLVHLYEHCGYKVIAANYLGDEGTHIAKCLWYLKNHNKDPIPDQNKGEYLGKMYAKADQMLDLSTFTSFPFPGVYTAKVLHVEPHPSMANAHKVIVVTADGKEHVVISTKGSKLAAGEVVAYVPLGSKFKGKLVVVKNIGGVDSDGLVLTNVELDKVPTEEEVEGADQPEGATKPKKVEHPELVFVFPEGTPLGQELPEYGKYEKPRNPDIAPLPSSSLSMVQQVEVWEKEVKEMLQKIESKEPEIHQLWKETKQWCLDEFHNIYNWVNARFDLWYCESEMSEPSKKLVQELYQQGKLILSEGCIGADLKKYKLGFCMLLKSDGSGLYATKDLALAQKKFQDFQLDKSIYVVDASQSLHFSQVFKTLELAWEASKASKCVHLPYGLVVLPDGKMSSRKGNVIYFSTLKQKLTENIHSLYLDQFKGVWPAEELEETTKKIAVSSIKYGMLCQDSTKVITFDMKAWTSLGGNTGPYLLYAYVRTKAMLNKLHGGVAGLHPDWKLLEDNEKQSKLLTVMSQFNDVVEKATAANKPHMVCTYLYGLSQAFNTMYEGTWFKHLEPPIRVTALAIVEGFGKLLQKGLELLGISTVDRM
jgi:arginyl-tRNA synthetase